MSDLAAVASVTASASAPDAAASDVLERLPQKNRSFLRFITFNVNGIRTLFHYHPWNKLRHLSSVFNALNADIVTLQELKVARPDVGYNVGKVDGYHSFVSVPSQKKGYSGVGVYVRIPQDDEPLTVKSSLKVIRAEEGLTGCLTSYDTGEKYRDMKESIGGYPNYEDDVCEKIDGEGRCVVIETGINVVIISVYCPANSMDTEEGEMYRIQFIDALLQRVRNLEKMGKQVVLMGDINISRDLIDSAVGLEAMQKNGALKLSEEESFERINQQATLSFIRSSIPRMLLNGILIDTIDTENSDTDESKVLIDTVRKIQGRKKGLYTVWNTIRNSRPGNFGSRIDLILVTPGLASSCIDANIWPFLMGSDHCPVFTDFDTTGFTTNIPDVALPRFEAKYVFKLSTSNIHSMFQMAKKRSFSPPTGSSSASPPPPPQPMKKPKISKKTMRSKPMITKSQNAISNFFKAGSQSEIESSTETLDLSRKVPTNNNLKEVTKPNGPTITINNGKFMIPSEKVPTCKHDEPCILKTARTSENKGRKFWTCSKSAGNITCTEDESKYNCGFFKWK